MSLEYPCVYYKPGGLCEKYSTDGITSYCVQGPCPDQSLSNSDRIRSMSDEEIAWELMLWRCEAVARYHRIESEYPNTQKTILKWLQQPAEEGNNGH